VSRARAPSARVAAALPPWRPCAGARHGARSARLRPRAWRERPVSSDRARRSPPCSPDEGGNQTSSVIIKRLLGRAALMREAIRGNQRQSKAISSTCSVTCGRWESQRKRLRTLSSESFCGVSSTIGARTCDEGGHQASSVIIKRPSRGHQGQRRDAGVSKGDQGRSREMRTSSGQLDTLPNSSKSIRVHIVSAKIS